MSEPNSCSDCLYHREHGDNSEIGECRRHAPAPVVEGETKNPKTDARWPLVWSNNDWCGEFEPVHHG